MCRATHETYRRDRQHHLMHDLTGRDPMNTMTELLLSDTPTTRVAERLAEAAADRRGRDARAALAAGTGDSPTRTWSLRGLLRLPNPGRRVARPL
jgi:hypothetical protein